MFQILNTLVCIIYLNIYLFILQPNQLKKATACARMQLSARQPKNLQKHFLLSFVLLSKNSVIPHRKYP